MTRHPLVLSAMLIALLTGCSEPEVAKPEPANLMGEEIGYFCNMIVVNHDGPKGHVYVAGEEKPLWFTSVRDTLAFTRLPGEPRKVHAIYVNDMGRAQWNQPEADTWIDATQAIYVVGSDRLGGMGAPELVPFRDQEAAMRFIGEHGGTLVEYAAIDEAMLFE